MLRLVAFFTILIAVVAAILGIILALSGWITHTTSDIVFGIVLFVAPLVALFFIRRMAMQQGRLAFDQVLEGFAPDRSGWFYGSGLAISSVRKQILVAGPTARATYPLDHLVSTEQIFTGDTPYGTSGPLAAIMIMIALVRIVIGYFTDGLFLHFKDGSKWQIVGMRRTEARRWAEELTSATAPLTP